MARKPLNIPFDQLVKAAEQAAREGKFGVARGLLDDAIKRAPKVARLYELGCQVAIAEGDMARAVAEASRWVVMAPADPVAQRGLTHLVDTYQIETYGAIDRRGLKIAFQSDRVSHRGLARVTLEMLVASDPNLATLLDGPAAEVEQAGRDMAKARRVPLSLASDLVAPALAAAPLEDHRLERLLTGFRTGLLLEAGPTGLTDPDRFTLALALLTQLFANDHAFADTDAERTAALAMLPDRARLIEGDAAAGRALLLTLLSVPIGEVPRPFVNAAEARHVRPKALGHLLADRLAADEAEAAIAADLPSFGEVRDPTSVAVRQQYERAPYPRWTSLALPNSGGLYRAMMALPGTSERPPLRAPFDVLIAGAGTGQQVIRSATGYGQDIHVTAVDLSVPSLAYGVRMARKLGIDKIDWRSGDLLDIGALGQTFQVIECVGVLHHMADPFEGWRRLLGVLAPNGLMYVGLYSRTARRPIEAARHDPASPGPGATDSAARAWRRTLIDRPADAPTASLVTSFNFNALAEFRDLTLHTSERQFDLDEIARFIEDERLTFLGFTPPPQILRAFEERFPGPPPGRLVDWAAFEADNPSTFEGMYCFWVAKSGPAS